MNDFNIKISVNIPFPREFSYREKAGRMHTAVARALGKFRIDVGRKRVKRVSIVADKL